jgi:hypothetical protein
VELLAVELPLVDAELAVDVTVALDVGAPVVVPEDESVFIAVPGSPLEHDATHAQTPTYNAADKRLPKRLGRISSR